MGPPDVAGSRRGIEKPPTVRDKRFSPNGPWHHARAPRYLRGARDPHRVLHAIFTGSARRLHADTGLLHRWERSEHGGVTMGVRDTVLGAEARWLMGRVMASDFLEGVGK